MIAADRRSTARTGTTAENAELDEWRTVELSCTRAGRDRRARRHLAAECTFDLACGVRSREACRLELCAAPAPPARASPILEAPRMSRVDLVEQRRHAAAVVGASALPDCGTLGPAARLIAVNPPDTRADAFDRTELKQSRRKRDPAQEPSRRHRPGIRRANASTDAPPPRSVSARAARCERERVVSADRQRPPAKDGRPRRRERQFG